MKTLRGIWYGIQLFWLAAAADPPPVREWLWRFLRPARKCERCLGEGEIRAERVTWSGVRDAIVEAPCKRCGGNGVEPV